MAEDRGEASPPPADLESRKIPVCTRMAGEWHRIGKRGLSPLHYSRDDAWRFSHSSMPGVLYLGERLETCFWEVFWDDLVTRPPAERRLDFQKVRERSIWRIELPPGLRVVDTTAPKTLRAIGAHGGTFSGPYSVCQRWADALRRHPANFDGILCESVRDKRRRCLALFAERTRKCRWRSPGAGTPLVKSKPLAMLLSEHGWHAIR